MATNKDLDNSRLAGVKKLIKDGFDQLKGHKADRKSANEEISAIRAKLETKGISKAAFDMAVRYAMWEPEKREGFDIAYGIVRDALGLPVSDQMDIEEYLAAKSAAAEQGVTE